MRRKSTNIYAIIILITGMFIAVSCKKKPVETTNESPTTSGAFTFSALRVNGNFNNFTYRNVDKNTQIWIGFSDVLDPTSINNALKWTDITHSQPKIVQFEMKDEKSFWVKIPSDITFISENKLTIGTTLKSKNGKPLSSPINIQLYTAIDSTDKFARISTDELLTLVQKQTFQYFWDLGHPNSGMALERNTSGNTITTGGSGFGIMAIPVAVERHFISRNQAVERMQKIVSFLKLADTFHGAFPHWLDGNTGKVVPFSTKDNGADLVETSFLIQGLLTARQYFNENTPAENTLRNDITKLYNSVEWNWFQKNGENILYWHWSPNYTWDINLPIKGWNECLVTYVLAASSPTFPITKMVYDNGWADNGTFKNGNTFYGTSLPIGKQMGGPLFFTHYSFLGLNPIELKDQFVDYGAQVIAQTRINQAYCVANPLQYAGYSTHIWGLTASDIPNSYTASSPNNDVGVIAPTAAIASIPYTPKESLKALEFYYYTLGDKLWGKYGFYDAFSIHQAWFASSFLAIDQGPMIIMIENYRTQLLWKLFMSSTEIKNGLQKLHLSSPNI